MINIEDQLRLLLNAARRLKKRVTAYAIGGTAMMFMGFKDATLDIDIVFTSEEDRSEFGESLKSLGYLEMDSIKVYFDKKNQPKIYTLGDVRFDLFVNQVIEFYFSEGMQKRSEAIHEFHNLILKIASKEDIIMLKCATDRVKDRDDARKIISSGKINWNVLVEEAKSQIGLGRETAAFELGCFLEELSEIAEIPKKVLDELFKIVQKQAKERVK